MGVYFASFEYIGRQISSTNNIEGLNSWQLLLAGGGAGMVLYIILTNKYKIFQVSSLGWLTILLILSRLVSKLTRDIQIVSDYFQEKIKNIYRFGSDSPNISRGWFTCFLCRPRFYFSQR